MFIRTTALEKITRLSKRIRGVSGGTSAAKTVSILMWLTDYCQTHKGRVAFRTQATFRLRKYRKIQNNKSKLNKKWKTR